MFISYCLENSSILLFLLFGTRPECRPSVAWSAVGLPCLRLVGQYRTGIEAVSVEDVSCPVEGVAHICPFGWLAGRTIVSRTVIILAVNVVGTGFFDEYRIGFPLYFREDGRGMEMEFVGCVASFRETVVPKKNMRLRRKLPLSTVRRFALCDVCASVASEERSVGQRSREFLPVGMTASTFPVLLP